MPRRNARGTGTSRSRWRLAAVALLFVGFAGRGGTQEMRPPGYYLPPPAARSPAGGHVAPGGLLDLNTATFEQLKALPGMGAEYARRIIAGRPYHAKNSLVRRGILPTAAYERIRDRIVAHRATATQGAGPASQR
ncbi:Helix-hairpin-helix motif-containing protein [Bryocella elongata]|uniref:Helix-hairpin-helix motif-containing protein n=1 Tax=Bryocella elongata TaxID=863522 RepID=A0A1H6BNI4_9BACT|nr:helix-hairpin-helix domain-containing protein [Bryocella elongata]SEG61967.1 Helix-hairpin-helix motif-containing protein [Bryocella elongata]